MERREVLKRIEGIDGELAAVRCMLGSLKTAGPDVFPEIYEDWSVEAAMKMERAACRVRHLIYATLSITKPELMRKVTGVHGIAISCDEGIFTVALPSLLPKKKKAYSSEFITDPLYFALDEYFSVKRMAIFDECVVVFEHVYDGDNPARRVCDYDNLELKPVLDTVAAFVMTDDSGRFCDVYNTSTCGTKDHTVVRVMAKGRFPEWLAER